MKSGKRGDGMEDDRELFLKNPAEDPVEDVYWFRTVSTRNAYILSRKRHHHPFCEWHFVLQGAMVYTVEGATVRISAGDHLFLPPGTPHRVERVEGDFVKLSLGFSLKADSPMEIALRTKGCVSGKYKHPEQIDFCLAEAGRNTVYSGRIIRNRLTEMLCLLAETVPAAETGEPITPDERLTAAERFIRSHPERFLLCGEVAKACGISPRQLTRLFERYERCSFSAYLRREKVRQVQRLLCESDLPLRTVSEQAGFDNEYYFNTFFKRCTGMTPGDFRRSVGKSHDLK